MEDVGRPRKIAEDRGRSRKITEDNGRNSPEWSRVFWNVWEVLKLVGLRTSPPGLCRFLGSCAPLLWGELCGPGLAALQATLPSGGRLRWKRGRLLGGGLQVGRLLAD